MEVTNYLLSGMILQVILQFMYDLPLLWTGCVADFFCAAKEHFLPRFCDVLRPPHGIESATAICHYVGCFPYMASLPKLENSKEGNPVFWKWHF